LEAEGKLCGNFRFLHDDAANETNAARTKHKPTVLFPFPFCVLFKAKKAGALSRARLALGGANRRSFCAFIYLSTSEQLNDFDFRRATAAVAALFCSFRAIYLPAAERREAANARAGQIASSTLRWRERE